MNATDKIAKDKEAVANMKLAKESMVGALTRIEALEKVLSYTKEDVEKLTRCFGTELKVDLYVNGGWKVIPIRDAFILLKDRIEKVL